MRTRSVNPSGFVSTQWSCIEEARQGRETALNDLLMKYRPPLIRYLTSRGATPEDAEDVVQEVLLALSSAPVLERADPSHGRFRCLLIAITRNLWGKTCRTRHSRKRGGTVHRVSLLESMEPAAPDSEEPAFDRIWIDHLLSLALTRLQEEDPRAARILHLQAREKLGYEEIADRLQITRDAVQHALKKARRRLAQIVKTEILTYSQSREEFEDEIALFTRFLEESY